MKEERSTSLSPVKRSRALSMVTKFALGVGVLAFGGGVVLGARSFSSEYSSYDVPRRASHLATEWQGALKPEPVEVPNSGWRGSYVAGRRSEVVVLLHGFGGCRDDLLPEMKLLSEAGFGVLAVDLPGHGESAGSTTLGEEAVAGLEKVHRFAADKAGVPLNHVGALGFSAGGFVLLRESLEDPDWAAIVVTGTPMDITDFLWLEHGKWGAMSYWPAYAAMRARGLDPETMRLGRRLKARKDVPLLVVVGDRDSVVPPYLALPVYENARGTKLLLEMENASHGDYFRVSSRYPESLLGFFEEHFRGGRGV